MTAGHTSAGGVVAAGHPTTAETAAGLLAEGGNAFDAALGGLAAACVAEPVLASLGGGGFLLAVPADGPPCVYDFFASAPARARPADALDFEPILADFGTTTQEFHIGLGAAAVPGTVAGLFAIHGDLGRLPLDRILSPAIDQARHGVATSAMQARIMQIVSPILLSRPSARHLFASPADPGRTLAAGEPFAWPALADALAALVAEGPDLFYRGEMAAALVGAAAADGGQITAEDLAAYRVERRQPLVWRYRDTTLLTNPPPSAGGALIAHCLGRLEASDPTADGLHGPAHTAALAAAIAAAEQVRLALEAGDPPDWLAALDGCRPAVRGTTHISVIDGEGHAASLTLSNGEGCGVVLPEIGCMPNNMLGESDLHPNGFHRWPGGRRLSSMMAPSVLERGDGSRIVLGSGGSNRIRSAIVQAIVNLVDFRLPAAEAVGAPRLHLEAGQLDVEPAIAEPAIAAAARHAERAMRWDQQSLYFGGVHTVVRGADGSLAAAGDPRRGGATAGA